MRLYTEVLSQRNTSATSSIVISFIAPPRVMPLGHIVTLIVPLKFDQLPPPVIGGHDVDPKPVVWTIYVRCVTVSHVVRSEKSGPSLARAFAMNQSNTLPAELPALAVAPSTASNACWGDTRPVPKASPSRTFWTWFRYTATPLLPFWSYALTCTFARA